MNQPGAESAAPVILGWDGSASSRAALLWVLDRERRVEPAGRSGLLVMAVVDVAFRSQGSAAMDQLNLAARQALDAELAWIAVAAPWVAATGVVATGDPVAVLQEQSPAEALIVVGHRFHEHGSGRSLSTQLAATAPQPVVVVSGGAEPADGPVVVGVDGTPASVRASVVAAAEASRREARLEVVHSWSGGGSVLLADIAEDDMRRSVHDRILAAAVDAIRADHPTLRVRGHLEIGPAADVLRRWAADASLVVVGSRGQGPVRRLLLGSVSTAMLDWAGCPVVVVTAPNSP